MNSNLKCDDDLAVSIPPQHKHHVLFIRAVARGTSTLVSCCSCTATASARIHATRAVFFVPSPHTSCPSLLTEIKQKVCG